MGGYKQLQFSLNLKSDNSLIMSPLNELLKAINTYPYPVDNVEIDIINFTGVGGHINIGEIWSFQVRVENNGNLDIKDLDLNIYGSEWTMVTNCSFPMLFRSLISSGKKDVNARSTVTYGSFYMRAVQATGTSHRDLVSVHISSYDTGLNDILNNHRHHANNPTANYSRRVYPN